MLKWGLTAEPAAPFVHICLDARVFSYHVFTPHCLLALEVKHAVKKDERSWRETELLKSGKILISLSAIEMAETCKLTSNTFENKENVAVNKGITE